ncbi:golgin subfamily A member 6-like protein 2 isoform X2 [Siniperca chuatsi]|uniref:golgin subfamily A member 6-like protein 2 isoform X2 n=1 Tax=Siniperca chuatsi TaxID=119488 RepID=UPI001CE0F570|nr:golgin subfamily A member 6-like protein 2 isoform X2 [Siniperca chuatsi]
MERRYNLRTRASGRVQTGNTTQHFRPQQYAPPAGVPPSSDVHSLRQALLSAEEDNLKLSYENAAMRQQISDLQEGNRKLMNENSCLQRTLGRKLHMAKQNINRLEMALEATMAGQDECKKREETIRENEKEISSLRESIHAQKEETERIRDFWMKECDKTRATFESELKTVKSVCDTQRSTDLQRMQTDCQRKVSQLQEQNTEQDKVISSSRDEIKARTEEHFIVSSQLSLKQTELDQSINKCNALDEEFKKVLDEREESWERRLKEMEKLWLEKEDALMKKELVLKKNKEKKGKKQGFWVKKKQKNKWVEEEGQKEKKEEKLGFWSWARKKKSDSKVEEGAGQQ